MIDVEREIAKLTGALAVGITRVFKAELARRVALVQFAASAAREQEIARQIADLEEKPDAVPPAREADERPVSDVQSEDRRDVPRDGAAEPPAARVARDEEIGGESVDAEADELDDDEDEPTPAPAPAKRDRFAAIEASVSKRIGVLPKSRTTVTF